MFVRIVVYLLIVVIDVNGSVPTERSIQLSKYPHNLLQVGSVVYRTRGQWPNRSALTRAMMDKEVVLYDFNCLCIYLFMT